MGRNQLYVPFEGISQCEGDQCRLNGTVSEMVPILSQTPYFRKGDRLSLQARKNTGFDGTLSSEAKEVFKEGGNQEARYILKFPKP